MNRITHQAPRPARLFGGLVLLLSLASGWLLMDLYAFVDTPLRLPGGGLHYIVAPGTSMKALAADLHQRGIVAHPMYLTLLARWHRQADRLRAGEYSLTPGMKPEDLLGMLVAGRVIEHALTVVEGWTFRQMMAAVAMDPDLKHTLTGLSDPQIAARLRLVQTSPEGLFHPDTYYFPEGTTDLTFLQRAHEALMRVLDREWRDRIPDLPYKTPYAALIAASIIERESAVQAERPRIAGVLVRRLQKGMPLAVDPTVIYGLGAAFDGDLRRQDLHRDTPYNTYLHRGLPPTPIALPSNSSLHAALHPSDGDALYYVAKGDGSHQFSATLQEHEAAVAKYQLGGRRGAAAVAAGQRP